MSTETEFQFLVNMHLGNYEDMSLANLTFFVISDSEDQIALKIAKSFRQLVHLVAPTDPMQYVLDLFKMRNHQWEEDHFYLFTDNGFNLAPDYELPIHGVVTLYYIEEWVDHNYNDRYAFRDPENVSTEAFEYKKLGQIQ